MILGACEINQKGYVIQGNITGYDEGIAILKQRNNSEFVKLDSSAISNGKF